MGNSYESGELWVILLAAGDGTRLQGLAADAQGAPAPKQFCTLDGRESMLRWSVNRALGMVPGNRIIPVVAARHRRWWEKELIDLPPENIVIQPHNRGTAAGILLPLLQVLNHDRRARVLILPSDHYVSDEQRLGRFMLRAVEGIAKRESRIVLLGMTPTGHDSDYGWIVPDSGGELTSIEAFIEKPCRDEALTLAHRGALINSFIIAAQASSLLLLYDYAAPILLGEFISWMNETGGSRSELTALYDRLPYCDFSKQILERSAQYLSVMPAAGCGWADLGTPARLYDHLEYRESAPQNLLGQA